jgi:hypothetical protein
MQQLMEALRRIRRREGQQPSARTVEIFGWIVLAEGLVTAFAPYQVAGILQLGELTSQSAAFMRLVGMLLGGIGMLYILSGRANAQGFVVASLLDRPLVPVVMVIFWLPGWIPGQIALLFGVSDTLSFLWTLRAWRRER